MWKVDTKQSILRVAGTLFSRYGRDGVGIRGIAKEANVSVNTVMYHFGNKDNLYRQVVLDQISAEIPFEKILAPIRERKTCSHEDVANNIALVIRNLFDVFYDEDRGEHADFMVQALFSKDAEVAQSLMDAFSAFDGPLMQYFAENDVHFDKPTIMFISYVLWSQILFYASAKESVMADMGVTDLPMVQVYDTARRIAEVFCQQLKLPPHNPDIWKA